MPDLTRIFLHSCMSWDTRSTSGAVVQETIPCLDVLSGKRGQGQKKRIAEISLKRNPSAPAAHKQAEGDAGALLD